MAVIQGREGIAYAILSECIFAEKLINRASILHQRYACMEFDNDVDCAYWYDKIDSFLQKAKFYDFNDCYNSKALSPQSIEILLRPNVSYSEIWSARRNRNWKRTRDILDDTNELGFEHLDSIQKQSLIKRDYKSHIDQTYDYITQKMKAIDGLSIPESWNDINVKRKLACNIMGHCLFKLKNAIGTLRDTRRANLIHDFMFEEFTISFLHKCHDELMSTLENVSKEMGRYTQSLKEEMYDKAIYDKDKELADEYGSTVIDSFINYNEIRRNPWSTHGYYVQKISTYLKLNYESFGRYVYTLCDEGCEEKAIELACKMATLVYLYQKKQQLKTPRITDELWNEHTRKIFHEEVEIDNERYIVIIDKLKEIAADIEQNMTYNYEYIALAIFAKYHGILKGGSKNNKFAFNATEFERMLTSVEWNLDRSKFNNSTSHYSILVESDKIDTNKIVDLNKIINPDKGAKITKGGIKKIQDTLDGLMNNYKKEDFLHKIS